MPLHVRTAPAPALRAVLAASDSPPAEAWPGTPRSGTSRDSSTTERVNAAAPGLPGETARVDESLPLYLISSVGADSPSTQLTGWCFLLTEGEQTSGMAHVVATSGDWEYSHTNGGPYAPSAHRCLRSAETLSAPYEPRLLAVPELYMVALWLRGLGPAMPQDSLAPADLLVPLSPAPPGITPELPQRVDGLLPLLTHRLTVAPTTLLRTA